MKKCKNCELNNFGWCTHYNENISKINRCDVKHIEYPGD